MTPRARVRTIRPHMSLALVAMTVAGCSQQPAAGSAPAGGAGSSGSALIRMDGDDKRSLYLSEQTLIAGCMRARGFQYRVVPPLPAESNLNPYGSDDVEQARRRGYGLEATPGAPADGDGAKPIDANAAHVRSLGPKEQARFQAALTGPPDGPTGEVVLADGTQVGFTLTGCAGEARKTLYGDARRYLTVATFVENLDTEIHNRVESDRGYLAAVDRWRACMRGKGIEVRNRAGAVEAAAADPSREREIAVLDAGCAREAKLIEVAERADRGVRARVYREHEGRIVAYSEMMREALGTAKRTLRNG